MKKILSALLVAAATVTGSNAQTVSPASVGVAKIANPYPIYVNVNNAWYQFGTINTLSGVLTLISAGAPIFNTLDGYVFCNLTSPCTASKTQLSIYGTVSGIVTITGQAAAGTYNFNLPTSAGTSGQPLLSGGGGINPMTFGTLGVGAGGTGLTSGTSGGMLYFSSGSTLASSADLVAGQVMVGGSTSGPTSTANFTTDGLGAVSIAKSLTTGANGGTAGSVVFKGSTSGSATVSAQAVAGTAALSLPTANGTLVSTASAPLSINATTGAASITGAAGQVLAGSTPAFTATPTLGVAGSTVGSVAFANATSGSITLQPVTGALGGTTLTMPATTGTLVSSATAPMAVDAVTGAVSITGGDGKILNGLPAAFTATPTLGVAGSLVGTLAFANATSGSVTLQPTTGALAANVVTIPATTGTMTVLGNSVTGTGNIVLATSPTISTSLAVSGTETVTSASATAFGVGANGAINPAFNIDASTASSATGVNIKSAAAAGGVAISALSSGTDEAMSINAKGAGAVNIANTSTGGATVGTKLSVTGSYLHGGTVPTPSGTCPIDTQVGGNTAGSFQVNQVAGCAAAATVVLTFANAAANGYVCDAHDQNVPGALFNQTARTTNSVTLTVSGSTATDNDVVAFKCSGF